MVTIIDFKKRISENGDEFNVLILQGGLEMAKSQETGKFYATAKKCSITSTFTDEVCQELVGTKIPGKVKKVSCDPYEFTVPETGEIIDLDYRWEYQPEEDESLTSNGITPEELMNQISSNHQPTYSH